VVGGDVQLGQPGGVPDRPSVMMQAAPQGR
jgi:hypothetical protein